ncbi:snf2 family n-terminal domain containing protein [Stylonychia lemnae]|uniref:Snf2 family n-terminal domain containing protein n=1 Tax=Stylonychia lemnae TaxID=5949 RepID=A0A078B9F0_STYLE|nr:snf2 family n-terminal domain containing protein [Stylonychia lemnae]|eukprot:CDW91024.1 snf2 family n-terminal domain containing protein [Stylonychia lemnae]
MIKNFKKRKPQDWVKFDGQTKCWVIKLEAYNDVYEMLYLLEESMGVKFNYFDDKKKNYNLEMLPQSLKDSLFNFQKEGVNFGISRYGRFLLGDEMGVGKTVQALARFTWFDEILKWLPDVSSDDICLISSGKEDIFNDAKIYIMSYEIASKNTESFVKRGIRMVIADEAHYLKAYKVNTLLTKTHTEFEKQKFSTPMLARPAELFNLIKMVRPDIFQDFQQFATRYCNPKESQFGMDYSGASNIKELHQLLEADDRKRIEEAIKERNKKFAQYDNIQISGVSYDGSKQFYGHTDDPEEKQLQKVYQLSGKAKIKGIIEFMDYMIESKKLIFTEQYIDQVKFILFAHHQSVICELENHLEQRLKEASNQNSQILPPYFIKIDGSTPPEIRHEMVKDFQEKEYVRVALLSITASSQGITLTAASTVIFAEVHWTPALMMQAEDRVHRIGQESDCVNIYYLYGKETLDEIIYPMIDLKSVVVARTLDDQKTDFKIKSAKKRQQPDYELKESDNEESQTNNNQINQKQNGEFSGKQDQKQCKRKIKQEDKQSAKTQQHTNSQNQKPNQNLSKQTKSSNQQSKHSQSKENGVDEQFNSKLQPAVQNSNQSKKNKNQNKVQIVQPFLGGIIEENEDNEDNSKNEVKSMILELDARDYDDSGMSNQERSRLKPSKSQQNLQKQQNYSQLMNPAAITDPKLSSNISQQNQQSQQAQKFKMPVKQSLKNSLQASINKINSQDSLELESQSQLKPKEECIKSIIKTEQKHSKSENQNQATYLNSSNNNNNNNNQSQISQLMSQKSTNEGFSQKDMSQEEIKIKNIKDNMDKLLKSTNRFGFKK